MKIRIILFFGLILLTVRESRAGWYIDRLLGRDGHNDNNANKFAGTMEWGDLDWEAIDGQIAQFIDELLVLAGRSGGSTTGVVFQQEDETRRQELGKRVFDCLGYIADFNEDRLPRFRSIRNFIFREFAEAYKNEENVNTMCAYKERLTERRSLREAAANSKGGSNDYGTKERKLRAGSTGMSSLKPRSVSQALAKASHLRTKERPQASSQRRRRRLGTPASPNYPSNLAAYASWAAENVQSFIPSGDLTERPASDRLINDIFTPLGIASTALVGLYVAEGAFEIVCSIVGSFELGFDPGDFCRIISTSIGLAAILQEGVVGIFESAFENYQLHQFLVDSAEIQATNTDAAALVTALI